MQPTTADSGAQEAAVLSQDQLYRIGQAARQSGQDVESAIDDVRKYLQDLVGSQSRENVLAAAERAVADIEGEAARRAAAQDESTSRTRSGRQTLWKSWRRLWMLRQRPCRLPWSGDTMSPSGGLFGK